MLCKSKFFFVELYKKLIEGFSEKKELAVAFERVLSDSRIPFVYLGKPLTMNQKDYRECIEKNEGNINKLIYILKIDYILILVNSTSQH